MGNKHKKRKTIHINKTAVAEEEREKIKNSILKVFRKRLHSTDGEGALLVNKESNSRSEQNAKDSKVCSKKTKTFSLSSDSLSTSSMNESDASPQQSSQKRTKQTRKRKIHASKVKKNKVHSEHSGVKRRIGAAQDIGHMLRSVETESRHHPVQKISYLSQSRITRRLGFFNKGKKSETIAREILIPESLKKKTKNDLIKILHHSDDDDRPVTVCDPFYSPKESLSTKESDTVNAKKTVDNMQLKTRSESPRSVMNSPASSKLGSTSIKESASEYSSQDISLQEPPYEEISDDLTAVLKPKILFKGRSYLSENIEELRKIMRQNAPRSATPTSDWKCTPVSSVNRSLTDSYPPKLSSSGDVANSNNRLEYKKQVKLSYSLGSRPSSCESLIKHKDWECHLPMEGQTLVKPKVKNSSIPLKSSDTITDANILLKCNDLMISDNAQKGSTSCWQRTDTCETDIFISDARQILMQNDTERIRKTSHSKSQNVSLGQHSSQSSNPKSQRSYREQSSQSSGYKGSQTVGQTGSQHGAIQQCHLLDNNPAVVTEIQKSPEHNPQVGTYYLDSLKCFTDHQGSHYGSRSQISSIDFLDLVDGSGDNPDNSIHILKSTTPDSDGSPLWLIPEVPNFPKRPSFESPSPPYKLYPRRLY